MPTFKDESHIRGQSYWRTHVNAQFKEGATAGKPVLALELFLADESIEDALVELTLTDARDLARYILENAPPDEAEIRAAAHQAVDAGDWEDLTPEGKVEESGEGYRVTATVFVPKSGVEKRLKRAGSR